MKTLPIATSRRLNSNSFKNVEIYGTIVWKIPKVARIYEIHKIYDPWKAYKKPIHILIKHQSDKCDKFDKCVPLCKYNYSQFSPFFTKIVRIEE